MDGKLYYDGQVVGTVIDAEITFDAPAVKVPCDKDIAFESPYVSHGASWACSVSGSFSLNGRDRAEFLWGQPLTDEQYDIIEECAFQIAVKRNISWCEALWLLCIFLLDGDTDGEA